LINDKSPDEKINDYLRNLKKENPKIELIEHKENSGFVRSVNEGMFQSKVNDVILLNSDTIVTKNWVNKLRKRAHQAKNIATVTPFSNSATIFSYPKNDQYNELTAMTPEEMNEIFERVGGDQPLVNVPTGHGFCLYVTREAINQVGLFDAETFGKGYGEENDFCQRAKLLGFMNVPAFDCFIYHQDGASFGSGSERDYLREEAFKKVINLHPRYLKEINDFVLEDPLKPFKSLIDLELLKKDTNHKILYIKHSWGGGADRHVTEMAEAAGANGWTPFVLTSMDNGFFLESPVYPNLQLLLTGECDYQNLREFLKSIGVNHLHFHHTIGLRQEVLNLAKELNVQYDFTLHDYYMVCPRINLLKSDNHYCKANLNEKTCNECLGTADGIANWRKKNLEILNNARKVFAPSRACADIYHKYFPNLKISVIPHPFNDYQGNEGHPLIGENPINIAAIGNLGIHKGVEVIKEASDYSHEHKLPINWFVIGPTTDDKALKNVIISGKYQNRNELKNRLNEYMIDIVLFPSIWPETFSYVVSEAWDAGLPVITGNMGAQAERVKEIGAGWVIDSLDPKTISAKVMEIYSNHALYDDAVKKIGNYNPARKIDWDGFYGDLRMLKNKPVVITEKMENIVKNGAFSGRQVKFQGKITELEDQLTTLDRMYFSILDKYDSVVNSKGWSMIKYARLLKHPRAFVKQSFWYFKKVMKKIMPTFLWNLLRSVRNSMAEMKFNLSLMLIKRKIKAEGQKVVISVAIPIYDRTKELEEAIESVLNQTFQNFELLLITDGSPADTLAVVDKYANHPKVRVYKYADNSGNSVRGRNKAILEARGKYLAFLDSDDICMPSRLADTVAIFENTGADVVYGGYEFMLDGTREIKDVTNGQKVLPQEFSFEDLKKANYLFNSATAVRTESVRRAGGLKLKMRYCEDYELWLRMLNQGAKFVPLKKSIIKYRLHGGNLELEFKEKEKDWINLALEEYKTIPSLPLKIAYVLPTTGIGGGPAVVCEHANRLKARGYDVTIVIDPVYQDSYDLSWFPNQCVPVIPLDKAVIDYDILIATGWTTAHTLKALNAKKKYYFVQSDERRFTDDRRTKERINKTYSMDYGFITEAKWIKKWLKDEFEKEAFLVPNAVNEKIFYIDEPLEKKNHKVRLLLEGPIDIGFKGLKEAFEVVKDLDCEVWCVSSLGKPKTGWRYDRFFEKVSQEKMRKIYNSCDILLKLSKVEGFFGPPLEMMACGGTAVVGDVTGYDEYIVNGENALVVKLGDIKEAKSAVKRLIEDRKQLERLKKGGIKTAKAMNWEKSIDKLEELINKESEAKAYETS
jgi:GT2 family glycosyltransferase